MKHTIIFLFLAAVVAFGSSGSIAGKVVDKRTGEPIGGANVLVQGTELGAATTLDGKYTVDGVEPGSYNVRFSVIGYKTIIENRVVVRPGKPTYLNVALEESFIKGEEVIVKPSFFEKTKDAVVSSKSMDFEEIITQPGGAWDVQRSVQALPAVVGATDQYNEIIVRGGNYGENLFILDNVEIGNPNHFSVPGSGGGPITMINTDFVENIDFYAGAFPAKYGDKASSVLDVRFREGADDALHYKFDVGMAGYGGTLEGPIGNGNFMLTGHRSFMSLIAGSFGLTAIPNYYSIQGKATYNLSSKQKLSLLGVYGRDWIYLGSEGDDSYAEAEESVQDEDIDMKTRQYAFGANLRSAFGKGFSVITFSRTEGIWELTMTDTLEEETYHYNTTEAENAAKLDITLFPFDRGEITIGGYLKNLELDYDLWSKPETLFIYDPETGEILDTTDYIYQWVSRETENSFKYGGYLQYKHGLGRFTLTGGLRYDYFKFTGNGYLSPRAGVTFALGKNTELNLAYGRHYQSPSWQELVSDTLSHSLESKYTDQIVVGIDHLFAEDVKGTVEGYYKLYNDVPVESSLTTPDPNDQIDAFVNAGKGYAYGIEFFLQKKVQKDLWGTLSYSYSIAKANDPRYPDKEFSWDFDYRNVFTSVVGYRKEYKNYDWYKDLSEKWWYRALGFVPLIPADESEYSFRYRYTGGKPYTPMTYHPEWRKWTLDETQEMNSARQTPYQTFDLHLQQRWYYNKWSLLVYWEIDNLFNNPNVWDYTYNSDGTKSTVYQRARMIVGGVVVEF